MATGSKNYFIWLLLICLSLFFWGDSLLIIGLVIAALLGRFLMLFSIERWLVLLLWLTLPFSLEINLFSSSKISFPSEGILLILFFSFVFNLLNNPFENWKRIKNDPVHFTLLFAALFFVVSIGFTAFFSSMPIVSFKFFLINLLFISLGLGYTLLLLTQRKIILREILFYIVLGLTLVVVFVLIKSFFLGFGRAVAPALPKPFFNDHTHLAATLLLVAPCVFYLWKTEQKPKFKRGYLIAIVLFILGLILTFSRASWLGGLVMLIFVFVWHFRVKKTVVLAFTIFGLLLLFLNKSSLENYFQINRNDSNRLESGLGEQIKSVTNISSDVSNLERLNRWKCAMRMGFEKPWFGFGPGTYQFQYLPFQRKGELTRISVKSPFYIKEGRGGTAHSEYLLSFSESGWLGLISWAFLIFSVIYSFRLIQEKSIIKENLLLSRSIFLGLIGYFIHAFLNNFLNTPNFALYFWFMIGLLIFQTNQRQKTKTEPN